jgi:nucleoid DNA-binding protein
MILRNLHRETTTTTMATITKREIVSDLSDQTGLTQSDTSLLVDAFIEMVGRNLEKGHNVTFRTFGTFEICVAKAKIGRNPNKPGSEVHIPERCVVRFKPGRDLKNRVASLPQGQ